MSIYRRGNVWWAHIKVAGKPRVRQSLNTMERDEALRMEQELRLKIANGSSKRLRDVQAPTLVDSLRRLLEERYDGDSEKVASSYATSLSMILGPDTTLDQIDEAHIDALVKALKKAGNSNATINRKLSLLQTLLKVACYRWKVIHNVPRFERMKEPKGRIRIIEHEEEVELYRQFKSMGEPDIADLMLFLIDTGCRLGEALRLQWKDINWNQEAAFIWKTKNDTPRVVVLTNRVIYMLKQRQYLESPFGTITKARLAYVWVKVREQMRLVDDKEFTIHALRHTCASRLVNSGVPLYTVQKLLGHSTIKVTERYAHLAPASLREAQAALNQHALKNYQHTPSLEDSETAERDGLTPYGLKKPGNNGDDSSQS